jgi:hypothetical protein
MPLWTGGLTVVARALRWVLGWVGVVTVGRDRRACKAYRGTSPKPAEA